MDFFERVRRAKERFLRKVMIPSDEEIRLLIRKKIRIHLKRDGPHAKEFQGFKFCLIQGLEKRGGRLFFKVLMRGHKEKIMEVSEDDLDLFGARIKIYQEGLFKEEEI